MHRLMLAFLGLLLVHSIANAQMEVKNIEVRYGPFGSKRPSLQMYPCETFCVSCDISGARANDQGKIALHGSVKLTDMNGNELRSWVAESEKEIKHIFNASGVNISVDAAIAADAPPGEEKIIFSVQNKFTSETVSFERKIMVLPAAFAITPPLFFYDSNLSVPAPAGGLIRQSLYFRCCLLGIDNGIGLEGIESKVELLDGDTQKPLYEPEHERHPLNNPLTSGGPILLAGYCIVDRPGDFILLFKATEKTTGKTITREVPVHFETSWPPARSR